MEQEFKALLDENFDASKEIERNTMDVFMKDDWTDFPLGTKGAVANSDVDTTYDLEKLKEDYARNIVAAYKKRNLNEQMMFVFNSKSFFFFVNLS